MGCRSAVRVVFVAVLGVVAVFVASGLAGTTRLPADEGRPPLVREDADTEVWSFPLRAGENYLALPLLPYDDTWEGLLGTLRDVLAEATVYDPVEGRWLRWAPSTPALTDAGTRVPSLILRLVTRAEATLHVEGRRFAGEIARMLPLADRLAVPGGWSFLGACWDASEASDAGSPALFEARLASADFRLGTDCLLLWDPSIGAWTPVRSASELPDPIARGSVFVSCRLSDAAMDPFTPAASRGDPGQSAVQQGGLSYLATLAGVDVHDASSADAYGSTLGGVVLTAHTCTKDAEGRPVLGSAWVNLPSALQGFTDLPRRVWGTVHYTTDTPPRIQRVSLANVHRVLVGPGTAREQRVEDVDELFVTADGLLYGTGWLRGLKAEGAGAEGVDLRVQLVWNGAWPAPGTATGTSGSRNALEIECMLGSQAVAALRWVKDEGGVSALPGWRVYPVGALASGLAIEQRGAAQGALGVEARLVWRQGEAGGGPEAGWVADGITGVLAPKAGSDLVTEADGATLEVFPSGLLRFVLNDGWRADVDGALVDVGRSVEAGAVSLHLMHSLAGGVGLVLRGQDLDLAGVRVETLEAGVELQEGWADGVGAATRRRLDELFLGNPGLGTSGGRRLVAPNSPAAFRLRGPARFAWGRGAAPVTAGVEYAREKARERLVFASDVDTLRSDLVDDDVLCPPAGRCRVERFCDQDPRRPVATTVVSVDGLFEPPRSWGLTGGPLPGAFTYTTDWWDPSRARSCGLGDLACSRQGAEFALGSTVPVALDGGGAVSLPPVAGVRYPDPKAPFALEDLTVRSGPSGLSLRLSGATEQRRSSDGGTTFQTVRVPITGSGSAPPAGGDDPGLLLALDVDASLVDADVARLERVFFARQDGAWLGGLGLRVRSPGAPGWASVVLMPPAGYPPAFSVTASVGSLRFADGFTLEGAQASMGKRDGEWQAFFAGALWPHDDGPLDRMGLGLGARVDWAGGAGDVPRVTVFSAGSTRPFVGDESLGLVFESLRGTVAWTRAVGGFALSRLLLSGSAGCVLPWMAPSGDAPSPAVKLALDYSRAFGSSAAAVGPPWTFAMKVDTEGLSPVVVVHGPSGNPADDGGFALTSLAMVCGERGFDWAGTADVTVARSWRDSLCATGGSTLPPSAAATITSSGGLRGPLEVRAPLVEPVGLSFGQVLGLIVSDVSYRRQGGTWRPSGLAELRRWGEAETSPGCRGRVERSSADGSFVFRPEARGGTVSDPLVLTFDEWSLTVTDFVLTTPPRLSPDLPPTCTVRGSAVIVTPTGKRVTGRILLAVGPDGAMTAVLGDVVGVEFLPVERAKTVTLSFRRVSTLSGDHWELAFGVAGSYVVPDFVPLIGGQTLTGSIEGDAEGEFRFLVTEMASPDPAGQTPTATGILAEVPVMPPPFPDSLSHMGRLEFSDLEFGRRPTGPGEDPQHYFTAQARLSVNDLVGPLFGRDAHDPLVFPDVGVGYEAGALFIEKRYTVEDDTLRQIDLDSLWAGKLVFHPTRVFLKAPPLVGLEGVFRYEASSDWEDIRIVKTKERRRSNLYIEVETESQLGGDRKMDGFVDIGDWGGTFTLSFAPPTRLSFLLQFDEPLDLWGPGMWRFRLYRLGFSEPWPGAMGADLSFNLELGNQVLGLSVAAHNWWWALPVTVPPIGFPFFDEESLRLSLLGFTAHGALALPRPEVPNPALMATFMRKVGQCFRDHAWCDLRAWLEANEEDFQRIFKGPGVGKVGLLLPYVLKPIFPDLEEVTEDVAGLRADGDQWAIEVTADTLVDATGNEQRPSSWQAIDWVLPPPSEGKVRRLKVPLMPSILFASDLQAELGLSWPLCLVRQLQIVDAFAMVCRGELGRVIDFIPEEYRDGDAAFKVEGFVKFDVGYRFVPDLVVRAEEAVPGAVEYGRFNRLANHLDEALPMLAAIAAGKGTPAATDLAFVDREGETFSGRVKDTFVNLKKTMAAAAGLRRLFDADGVEFSERLAFRRHMDWLTKVGRAVFTPGPRPGPPCLEAKLSPTRTSRIQLHGLTGPVTFRNDSTGAVYFKDRSLALYATTTLVRTKDGADGGDLEGFDATADAEEMGRLLEEEQTRRLAQVKDLSAEEERLLREAAARLGAANQAIERVRAQEAQVERLKGEADGARTATAAWYSSELQRIQAELRTAPFMERARLILELSRLEVEHRQRVAKDDELRSEVRNAEVALQALRAQAEAAQIAADQAQAAAGAAGQRREDAQGAADVLSRHLAGLDAVVIQPYVIERGHKLYAAFDATVRDLSSGTVLYRGTIPEQLLYDLETGAFSPRAPVVGWLVSHALDDEDLGRATFSDYGTMKIEAPLTVVTWQFPGSKLNKLRDILDYLGTLPVFESDCTPFLLANAFWYNLEHGSPPALGRSVQGRAVKVTYDKGLDVVLSLDDVRYGADDEDAGSSSGGMKLSVRSDIRRFYRLDQKLFAQPFEVAYATSGGHDNLDDANAPPASTTVSDLLVLDGSDDMERLFGLRLRDRKDRVETLFDAYDQLGLNWDFQQMKIRQVTVECRDAYLLAQVRPGLVSVTNVQHGAEILHIDAGSAGQLARLLSGGPYGDPSTYPSREKLWYVECRGFSGETRATTERDEDLISLFEHDLLLREVDLTAPRGLLAGDLWQGTVMADHLEARSDGLWQTGLVVPGSTLPEGVAKLMREGEAVVAHLEAPSGKPVQIRRRFGGDVEVLVEREPGNWVGASFVRDETDRITGGISYPTGEVIPGGFFVHGLLNLGSSSVLSGGVDFAGAIKTNGDFTFGGGCDIYILGKNLTSARFIIDRRDGLYITGLVDVGIARVFIEGRLKSDYFSLVGELDVRLGGLLGVKAGVTINPSLLHLNGDVVMAGRKIFHGLIHVDGTRFDFAWAMSSGRVGADADVTYDATRNEAGKVTAWSVGVVGKVWVNLPSPFGRPSTRFAFGVGSDGSFRVRFSKVYVSVNIPRFSLDWGWD